MRRIRSLLWVFLDASVRPDPPGFERLDQAMQRELNIANAAVAVLEDLKKHNSALVEAAELVSTELIRVAILWHERWHGGLEEASRLYFGDKNIEGMFAVLTPLHNAPHENFRRTQNSPFYPLL